MITPKKDLILHIRKDQGISFEELCEKLGERKNQKSRRKISNAVQNIKGNPRGNPKKRLLKIHSKHNRLCGGIEDSKGKAVQSAEQRIDHYFPFSWHFSR